VNNVTTAPLAYSLADAARLSGVSPDSIRKAIHSTGGVDRAGNVVVPLVGAKKLGSKYIIPAAALAAWIENLTSA
jgi:hypothetical protein